MLARISLLILLCLSLSACSSGEATAPTYCISSCDTDVPEDSEEVVRTLSTSGGYSGGVDDVSFDASTGVFTLMTPSLNAQMARFPTADYGDMLAMRDAAGLHNAYFGQGQGSEIIVYSGRNVGSLTTFASYARTGETDMPLKGDAQFIGDYAGFTSTRRINGNAQIDVDFENAKVSGRITNRVFRQRADNVADVVNPLSTILLEETDLTDAGGFSGVTAGGQIVNGQILWNPATGTFEGLIAGPDGQEAVGTVTLTHRAPSGVTFEETGGFLASQ
ncbi:hypothetical protein [Planktotalea sp.]|uniref:hypothetical protein n=1 Tax=Planktotalea sp. TaxID=2029877 RepID=UPI00329A11D7